MDPNTPGYQTGYWIGVIFGGLFAGMLCGLLPLWLGRKRNRMAFGWIGFALCAMSGIILGLIAAVPMAALTSVVILVVGPPSKRLAQRSNAGDQPLAQ